MPAPHYRYFIETQPREGTPVPRSMEAETRRTEAIAFLATIRDWLLSNDLNDKVSTLSVTAFGQIQLTCEAGVMKRIHKEEVIDIATIREGAMFMENASRWNDVYLTLSARPHGA